MNLLVKFIDSKNLGEANISCAAGIVAHNDISLLTLLIHGSKQW